MYYLRVVVSIDSTDRVTVALEDKAALEPWIKQFWVKYDAFIAADYLQGSSAIAGQIRVKFEHPRRVWGSTRDWSPEQTIDWIRRKYMERLAA